MIMSMGQAFNWLYKHENCYCNLLGLKINPLVPDDVHRRHCFISLLLLMTSQDIQNSLVFSQGQGHKARNVVSAAGLNELRAV